MYTSDHARDRIQERCGINKASCDRIAKIAFENGLTHAEATGQLKAYITKVFNRNESANNIRIYAEKNLDIRKCGACYSFSDTK